MLKTRWKIISRLEMERPVSFKWIWSLMRSSELRWKPDCSQSYGKCKLTKTTHSHTITHTQGAQRGDRKTRAPTFSSFVLITVVSYRLLKSRRWHEVWCRNTYNHHIGNNLLEQKVCICSNQARKKVSVPSVPQTWPKPSCFQEEHLAKVYSLP